jgi:hypothetical protein
MPATAPLPQHMVALKRANEVQAVRRRIKREIADLDHWKACAAPRRSWLPNPPDELRSMMLAELLCAIRRQGRHYTRRLLEHLAIPERKPLGDLTPRQREALVVALGAAVPGHADLTRRALGTLPAPPKRAAKKRVVRRQPAPRSPKSLIAWCPKCLTEVVTADDDITCPWCDTRTQKAAA